MQWVWNNRNDLFQEFKRASTNDNSLVEWCGTLPWVGNKTKYHLAMNCGADVCKPDIHLCRVAEHQGQTVHGLCRRLSVYGGSFSPGRKTVVVNRISVVDRVLWYALKDEFLVLDP